MPPKKKGGKKAPAPKQRSAQKIIEDKTFGMKNKKNSKKAQLLVKQAQYQERDRNLRLYGAPEEQKKSKKQIQKEKADELRKFLGPAAAAGGQQLRADQDPKTVLCQFFVRGMCTRGDKCKFSHDPAVGRKAAKLSLHHDRQAENASKNFEDWSQSELADVIDQKHGAANTNMPTKIVCKHFLIAIEEKKYGWLWECPDGVGCKYRHCLPPGFVLKSKTSEKDTVKEDKLALELRLESERQEVLKQGGGTEVTLERLLDFIEELKVRRKKEAKAEKNKLKKVKQDKGASLSRKLMSGRALFEFKPELLEDDADAATELKAKQADEDEEVFVLEVTDSSINAKKNDKKAAPAAAATSVSASDYNSAVVTGAETEAAPEASTAVADAPIDESLFAAEEADDALQDLSDDEE
eukprot:CAMPEP_0177681058 /NCGR_PEP_ID=MMETSP0447-20121125/30506_1 /TAXON_ID=0 /ORGANISM="Stygamoeba regulata, Strain BSH-02190019" /LENGTH=408 /DNA_ID=CAMNT_0019190435 /DNA_START=108 /DNA_END=1334 /DNA_ORIENTATION=-